MSYHEPYSKMKAAKPPFKRKAKQPVQIRIPSLLEGIGYPGLDFILLLSVLCVGYLTFWYAVFPVFLVLMCMYLLYMAVQSWRELENFNLKGHCVLITGCDTGIGFSLARRLDKKGIRVFATCLDDTSDGAKKLLKTGSRHLRVLPLDVTSNTSVIECFLKVKSECRDGGLWALVNNAGCSLAGDIELQPMSYFYKYAEVNMFGVVRVCKAFLPLLRRAKGRIINVTSTSGIQASPTAAPYVMSKFGAEGFSDCLRLEVKRFGVKVIVVEPGNYNLNVGQFNDVNRKAIRALTKHMIDTVNPEVREAYGKGYFHKFVETIPKALPFSDDGLRGILQTLEAAVIKVNPRSRYLVGSTNTLVDTNCMLARLRTLLPVYLLDMILLRIKPLPKEAFETTNHKRKYL